MNRLAVILAVLAWVIPAAAFAADTTPAPTAAPMTTTQVKAAQAANAKAQSANALIAQVQKAQDAKDWAGAESLLKQLTAMDPSRWDYNQHLADAQYNLGKYADAAQSYEKAVQGAAQDTDPAAKQAMGGMYTNQGNAYLKLKRNDAAIAAFDKAVALSDNPGVAYFNLCAVLFNAKEDKAALSACDKAIAADPSRADAYYIKGSILVGEGETDANNKFVVPRGTTEALQTYLKLAPRGAHAGEVQQFLDLISGKI